MANRMWLLVEWMDEGSQVFPKYGVVNANSLFNKTEFSPGKVIYVPMKHGNGARRAQMLRISDSKSQMKEYKLFLERQDRQVKNVVSVCMRSIQEMKTNPMMFFESTKQPPLVGPGSSLSTAGLEDSSDSSSDPDDSGAKIESKSQLRNQLSQILQPTVNPSSRNFESSSVGHRNESPVQTRRSITSSTPLPRTYDVKLTFDHGTQTEETGNIIPVAKIEQLEKKLKATYEQYLILEAQLHALQPNVPHEQLLAESDIDIEHTPTEDETESDRDQTMGDERERQNLNHSNVGMESNVSGHNTGARTLHVRRVSAHTTNVVETSHAGGADMVPIGAGYATVPARLLNEINWTSHSNATRQLLQAVFPRRILATHSLSGKPSPAFANKPPKKQLDSNIIADIVDTVSERCGVSKRLVRTSITIKCTDEAKMYRNRQHRYANAHPANLEDMENVPPSPVSSESSHPTD